MTDERKLELFEEMLNYICYVSYDDDALERCLDRIGFTKEEIHNLGIFEEDFEEEEEEE